MGCSLFLKLRGNRWQCRIQKRETEQQDSLQKPLLAHLSHTTFAMTVLVTKCMVDDRLPAGVGGLGITSFAQRGIPNTAVEEEDRPPMIIRLMMTVHRERERNTLLEAVQLLLDMKK